jgi:hypothetical protein
VIQADHRHLGHAERFDGLNARMASDDPVLVIDENRVDEADLANAGSELLNLLARVRAGISGGGFERRRRAVGHRQREALHPLEVGGGI